MSRASDAWPHPHRCPHGPDGADLPPGLARAREGRPLRRACGGQRPRAASSLQAPCQDLTFFDIFHLPKEGSSPYLKFVRNWSMWSAACSGSWARVPRDSMRGSFLCAPEGVTAWRSSRVPSLRGSSLTGRCPNRRQPPPPRLPRGDHAGGRRPSSRPSLAPIASRKRHGWRGESSWGDLPREVLAPHVGLVS